MRDFLKDEHTFMRDFYGYIYTFMRDFLLCYQGRCLNLSLYVKKLSPLGWLN